MSVTVNHLLRRYRLWVWVAFIGLAVIVAELIEHRPFDLNHVDDDFASEVLVFGLVLPFGGAFVLGKAGSSSAQSVQAATVERVSRVLVVENELMGSLVKAMLSDMPNLVVIGMTATDSAALLAAINLVKPQVVVMDHDRDTGLIDPPKLPDFFRDHRDLRLVFVSAGSDWVQVFDMKRVLLAGREDLASLIQHV